MRRDLPEAQGLLIFKARAEGVARYTGHLPNELEQGMGAADPRWIRSVTSLPDYSVGEDGGNQNPDGSLPFILDLSGLGNAPLD